MPGRHSLTAATAAALAALAVDGQRSFAADPRVFAYPGPGWRVAGPRTSITFSGADLATLGSIRVSGSISGPHAGRVHALRSEPGGVFTPDRRFENGEQVTVQTDARIMGADG